MPVKAKLVLEDGTEFEGRSFSVSRPVAGEVVFNTGMVGYTESLTDPSYGGQIMVLTYPLVGNYGVPEKTSENGFITNFESHKIQAAGLIVSDYSKEHSHWASAKSLGKWLREEKIPAITGIDTRELTKRLREKGTMLGKIVFNEDIDFFDPNKTNLAAIASIHKPIVYGKKGRKILLVDCGAKNNIIHGLLKRNLTVIRVPWDYDFWNKEYDFDGILLSNGPGDPKQCTETIKNIKRSLKEERPTFGVCLGNQILGLAAGADTYKLKYGHRSQNQPCRLVGTNRCFITSQNHGYAVDEKALPKDWLPWFENVNDNTNEGIRHRTKPFMSVQFHPEANPGPNDTEFLFDEFLKVIR